LKTVDDRPEVGRRRSIVAYVLCCGVYAVTNNLYGASYVLLMRSRGLSPARIGQVLFVSVLVLTVTDYPSGTLADRYGRRKMLGLGFVVWGGALVAFGLAHRLAAVFAAVAVWAVALALVSGTASSWLVDRLRAAGDETSYRRILPRTSGMCLLVAAAAAAAGSPLVARGGLAAPVMTAGVIAIVAGVLILLLMPENFGAPGQSLRRSLRQSTIHVLRGPLRRLLFVNFAASIPLAVFLVAWQIDATDRAGLPPESLGAVFAGLILATAAGNLLAGALIVRISSRRIAMLGCTVLVAGGLGALGARGAVSLVASLVATEVGLGLFNGSFASWIQDLAEQEYRAAMTSAVLTSGSAAGMATTPVVGLLLEHSGSGSAWVLAVGGAAVALALMAGRQGL